MSRLLRFSSHGHAPTAIPHKIITDRPGMGPHYMDAAGYPVQVWPDHGYGNCDTKILTMRSRRSPVVRFLMLFPKSIRVPVGVTIMLGGSAALYYGVVMPRRTRQLKTMTPEWIEANKAYAEAQNINPIRRYKELK